MKIKRFVRVISEVEKLVKQGEVNINVRKEILFRIKNDMKKFGSRFNIR